MTEPWTMAGRALLDEWFPGGGDGLDSIELSDFCAAIRAIEAEAVEGLRAGVAKAIDDLDPNDPPVLNLNLLLADLRNAGLYREIA